MPTPEPNWIPERKPSRGPPHPETGEVPFPGTQSGEVDLLQHRGTELHFGPVRGHRGSEAHSLVRFSHVPLEPWEVDRGSFSMSPASDPGVWVPNPLPLTDPGIQDGGSPLLNHLRGLEGLGQTPPVRDVN